MEIKTMNTKTNIFEQTEISLLDFKFKIKAKHTKEVYGFPNDKNADGWHNQFNITLFNMETKKRISFKFYGSRADYDNDKAYMEEKEFPFLLYCFISDARSGQETFDVFCSEFGYDTDSRSAEKIYKACIKSMKKAYKLGIETDQDFCDLLNELNKKYKC